MTAAALSRSIQESQVLWDEVRLVTFEVRQSLRYEYPGPIYDVHQILALIPPDITDGQRVLSFVVDVRPEAMAHYHDDAFGNRLCRIALPSVDRSLEFDVRFRLNRWPSSGRRTDGIHEERIFRLPSPLTEPGPAIAEASLVFQAIVQTPFALADAVNQWVHERLVYRPGVTGIETTAEAALAQGAGVCQDYAHLMIALCRQHGLPARYVSGHLLGEGSMHAWVEVLLPDPASPTGASVWQAFDPTHGGRPGLRHLLVAVGRDYGDVSPTRGSFRAPFSGHLAHSSKSAVIVAVE